MAEQFIIDVKIDPTGANRGGRNVESRLQRIEKRSNALRRTLLRTFGSIGVGLLIRELAQLADTYVSLRNKLRIVTKDSTELGAVMDELFVSTRRARASFENTAQLYTRVSLATKELGRSQRELISFTESLNQAIAVSGATSREANAALIQLSQGLSRQELRGDELRSVSEQLPFVLDVIADHAQLTRGELLKLGETGGITTTLILDAFKARSGEIQRLFNETQVTLGQGFTVLRNSLVQYIGQVNDSIQGTTSFSATLLLLADNIDVVAKSIAALTLAVTVLLARLAIARIIAFASGVGVAATAVFLLVGALSSLVVFSSDIKMGDGFTTLADVAKATFNQLVIRGKAAFEKVKGFALSLVDPLVNLWGRMSEAATRAWGSIQRGIDFIAPYVAKVWNIALRSLNLTITVLVDLFKGLFFFIRVGFESVSQFAQDAWHIISVGALGLIEKLRPVAEFIAHIFEGAFFAILHVGEVVFNGIAGVAGLLAKGLVKTVDFILNLFVGLFKSILATWRDFPRAFADLIIQGVNALVDAVRKAIDAVAEGINKLLDFANLPLIPLLGEGGLGQFKNPFEGAAAETGKVIRDTFAEQFKETHFASFLDSAGEFIVDKFQAVTDTVSSYVAKNFSIGEDTIVGSAIGTITGIFSNIGDTLSTVWETFRKSGLSFIGDVAEDAQTSAGLRFVSELRANVDAFLAKLGLSVAPGAIQGDPLKAVQEELDELKALQATFGLTNREREIELALLKQSKDLKRDLTPVEESALRTQLEMNQALQEQDDMLQDILGPLEDYVVGMESLDALLGDGRITLEQYAAKQRELELAWLDSSRTLEGGFRRGLIGIGEEFGNLSLVIEDTLLNAFQSAEDALVEFVRSGKFNIRDLVDSILTDLARLTIRQSITGPLASFLGNLGGSVPSSSGNNPFEQFVQGGTGIGGSGRAFGGPIGAGEARIVGENRPEIFVPKQSGRVLSKGEQRNFLQGGRQGNTFNNTFNLAITTTNDLGEVTSQLQERAQRRGEF